VGNITLGGTGKTSLVELIAKYLKQKGYKVAILSRGYKRKITNHESRITNHETMGDEPYMLSKKLKDIPVIVDKDRIRGASAAIKEYSVDVVVLDDALQQWKIKKDLEIVTIDATCPFGNQHLIPRGILRQPLSTLKDAGIFVLTHANLKADTQQIKNFLIRINPSAFISESMHQPVGLYEIDKPGGLLNPNLCVGKTVTLFSGIGNPNAFENLMRNMGVNIGLSFRFPDHHSYSQEDLYNIVEESKKKNIDTVITTEKDAVRLYSLQLTAYSLQFFVLRVALKIIQNEEGFYSRLLRVFDS
jgi:tetraacyldisaccharide 4'-kinase